MSILQGDMRAAAQLMRDLDDHIPGAVAELQKLYPHTGRAYVVGITGNSGAGKSTIVDALIERYRARNQRVGVVAVDPTSPFSGGAILGDRIRMQRHATDDGVFIRSLATRGHLGGLSRSTADVVLVLDAMGFDIILVETVGVGQDEIDIMSLAHTAVVVTVPGLGDEVQAIKAGILEIADIIVVNKADREGADRSVRDLTHMLELRTHPDKRSVDILKLVATQGQGIDHLVHLLENRRHSHTVGDEGQKRALARAQRQLLDLIQEEIFSRIHQSLISNGTLGSLAQAIATRTRDPYTIAQEIVAKNCSMVE